MNRIVLMASFICIAIVGVSLLVKLPLNQKSENILKTAFYSDIATFHFAASNKGSYINSSYVIPLVFEGLLRKDKNEIPKPAIAKQFTTSPDRKKYTFYLRDTRWSDGVPVTAYDFEYAWKTVTDPQSKSRTILSDLFYPIRNMRKFIAGECFFEDVGITVVDEKTIILELEYPAQYFLDLLCSPLFLPAPKHIAEKNPDWCNKEEFVCNGPFFLKKWYINSEIFLSKNPLYWDKNSVYLDGIDIYIFQEDHQNALNMFEKGKLDWIGSPFMKIPYDTSYKILKEKGKDSVIYFFTLNNEKYPFNNQKFRQALSYAIDRKAIVENVFHDTAEPIMSALPSSLRLSNMPYFEDDNIELAKKAFQEALQELQIDENSLPEIELLYNSDAQFFKRICLAAQDQWRKNLNLNVKLKGLSGANLCIDTIQKGDYQMAAIGAMAPIFDPLYLLQAFEKKSDVINRCNWENENFKNLLRKSNESLGEIERRKILAKAEEILMDEMPIIPICSMYKRYAKNPKLHGENLSYLQFVDFKSAYFEDNRKNNP